MEDVPLEADVVRALLRAREEYAEPFPLLAFPVKGGGWWLLLEEEFQQLQESFPQVAVALELRAAYAWVSANTNRRKTARGMPRFLTSWLARG